MPASNRRYDIDWIRVIAIGLLIIYHIAIEFQPWGIMVGFITTKTPWFALWTPMTMLNVWRIPLLFFVSGMGVYFAMTNRNWKQLLLERTRRILIPFLFGAVVIVPIHMYVWQSYNNFPISYCPMPAHLWFLANIFFYVVTLSPLLFFLKRHENSKAASNIKKIFSTPLGLLPVIALFVAEVLLVDPHPFELYAMTAHGFFLGMLAFFCGFSFVWYGDSFRSMMTRWRWLFFAGAVILYAFRLIKFQAVAPNYLISIESCLWIFTVLAFGYRYLNHSNKALTYLSQAAYPVYIIHMVFLYLTSYFIFQWSIPVQLQFVLVTILTFAGCMAFYEWVIRRANVLRLLFGLKTNQLSNKQDSTRHLNSSVSI